MPPADEIEQGIDALDRLRGTMRAAGMSDCADALDEVFVRCLKDYVERKGAGGSAGRQGDKSGNDSN
jgi:hypothetical protein